MPTEYTSPSQDFPLRLFDTSPHEYFAEVRTIRSQDKESEPGDRLRALSSGRSCESVLVLGVIIKLCDQPHPASEISVRGLHTLSSWP